MKQKKNKKQLSVKGQTLEVEIMNRELVKYLFTAILCEEGDTVTAKRPEDVKSSNLISITLPMYLMVETVFVVVLHDKGS